MISVMTQHVSKYRCLEIIAPDNNWSFQIGQRLVNLSYLKSEEVWDQPSRGRVPVDCHFKIEMRNDYKWLVSDIRVQSVYNAIEEDPIRSFDYIQKASLKNEIFIPSLAVYLSGKALEKIMDKIFSKKDVDPIFLQRFYYSFFSHFLFRRYTWFSLHILVRASKAYPELFITTFVILMGHTFNSSVLLDFVERLDEEECTKFMKVVATDLYMTEHIFDHTLPVIYILFKKCRKLSNIFQYIYKCLRDFSDFCAYNTFYGSLLLTFIQNSNNRELWYIEMKALIERHRTAYKNLALATLDKLANQRPDVGFPEENRIVIPRVSEQMQL